MLDKKLLNILVCPTCKGELRYHKAAQELRCMTERLAYPIQDGIPVMITAEARTMAADET